MKVRTRLALFALALLAAGGLGAAVGTVAGPIETGDDTHEPAPQGGHTGFGSHG